MECNQARNTQRCSCTYEPCPRKGLCCECIFYHRQYGELPGCLFPPQVERTYDRTVANFVAVHSRGR